MKKIIKISFLIILLILVSFILMLTFSICPPNGPWVMPPWCQTPERIVYTTTTTPSPITQIKAVNMFDTWGRNYNMGMFETTQKNIESSFDRVKDLGAEEIFVHDFHMAKFAKGKDFTSTDYVFVDETFWNDFRDESINKNDLQKLVSEAHNRNLRIGINHNLHFVDTGKYMFAGGNIQKQVEEDYRKFNSSHTEEWTRDFFQKWTVRLVEKAKIYEEAKVDMINITPSFMDLQFAKQEKLVNNLQKDLIKEVRKVFSGKIICDVSRYGFVEGKNGDEDWTQYDYYKNADIVQIKVYDLPKKYWQENIADSITMYIKDLDQIAKNNNVKLSIFFAPSSYNNSLQSGPIEVLDFINEKVINTNADYKYQSASFESLFKSLLLVKNIERINVANFAWDDSLDPQVKPKLSISTSFRNKPAEEVVAAWYKAKR